MRYIWGLMGLCFLASCANRADSSAVTSAKPAQIHMQSANSNAFNTSFTRLLDAYFMASAFMVDQQYALADSAVYQIRTASDSLQLTALQADSTVLTTARSYAAGISAESDGFLGEKDPQEKIVAFRLISDQLYDLIRTVRYDREKIYHPYCDDVFNGQGASWLSRSRNALNPYDPKLRDCIILHDSIDFTIQTFP
jgi:hypothetical protein